MNVLEKAEIDDDEEEVTQADLDEAYDDFAKAETEQERNHARNQIEIFKRELHINN